MRTLVFNIAGMVILLIGAGCRPHVAATANAGASNGAEALVRITPVQPARETLVRTTEQPGQVLPLDQTPIYANVSGYVRKVPVDIGDKVTGPVIENGKVVQPGQTLLEIDVPELEKDLAQRMALVEQAKAEIKQAEAAVKVAQAARASAAADVDEAKAMVERVEAERDRWKLEFDRISELAAREAVTAKLVEETQSKFRAADAARQETAAKIVSAGAHLKEADALVEKAQADTEAAAAKRDVAVAERERTSTILNYAIVRAPYSGVVAARRVDQGQLVSGTSQAKEPLLIIVRSDTVRVQVDVPEADAVFIAPGTEATLKVAASGITEIKGKVARSTWVLNQATRTLRIEVDVLNADGRLRPGMYATAVLKVAEKKDALAVPKTAIMTNAGQASCWRVESDGKLVRQVVQTGMEAGGKVEVLSGLSSDQSIVGVNPAAFRDGQHVEVVAASK